MATDLRHWQGDATGAGAAVATSAPTLPPLRRLPPPGRLYVPLLQHQGEPARPCVVPGQQVCAGERIGNAVGPLSAPVHAPLAGRVLAISERDTGHASGRPLPCIELLPDGRPCRHDLPAWPDWHRRPPADLLARIAEAGVTGLGGAVFPTAAKLAPATASAGPAAGGGQPAPPVATLIINAVECEPFISCDQALLAAFPEQVLAGAALLGHLLGAGQVLVAVDRAREPLRQGLLATLGRALEQAPEHPPAAPPATADADAAAHDSDSGAALAGVPAACLRPLAVVAVPGHYPHGGERQLIHTLTGRALPAGRLPRDEGLACVNAGTAVACWRAVARGEALTERIVTVTGPGVAAPVNLVAPLGTPVADLVAAAGGYTGQAARLVLGGPMMGQAVASDQVPLGKSGNCVLVLAHTPAASARVMPCIRCGDCARACPVQLLPQQLHAHIQARQWPRATALGLADCIECGLCAQACPSHIPLVAWFRHGKGELAWQQHQAGQARAALQRHEARRQRLEQEAAERAARLHAREAATVPAASGQLPPAVAAALARARARTPAPATPETTAGRVAPGETTGPDA